jgi:predicted transcriptional regulator
MNTIEFMRGSRMPKTITIRLDDSVYDIFKKAADGERRTISNFLEFATLAYVTKEIHVSDDEMNEILSDLTLVNSLKKGLKDIKNGNYRLVD